MHQTFQPRLSNDRIYDEMIAWRSMFFYDAPKNRYSTQPCALGGSIAQYTVGSADNLIKSSIGDGECTTDCGTVLYFLLTP